jgi:hypothetical protein
MTERRRTKKIVAVTGRRDTDFPISPSEQDYSKREVDEKFTDIKEFLIRIETQTSKTNGRVTRLEKVLLITGVASSVVLVMKFPEVLKAVALFL